MTMANEKGMTTVYIYMYIFIRVYTTYLLYMYNIILGSSKLNYFRLFSLVIAVCDLI